jgi:hypothetical protein
VRDRLAELWAQFLPAVDFDESTAERVHAAPPAGDVEQFDAADAHRQGRVDEQVPCNSQVARGNPGSRPSR